VNCNTIADSPCNEIAVGANRDIGDSGGPRNI
jgi:hypothetical protein